MDIIDILLNAVGDPFSYSLIFFIYVVLAAIILPIPVEIGLFNQNISAVWLLLILSIGKGVGAFIVFEIGSRARGWLKRISKGGSLSKKIVAASEQFVIRYGYYGLFIIMSIPLMLDSVTLYLFSLLNPEENKQISLGKGRFIAINMVAAIVRGGIILTVAYYAGIKLV